VTRTPARNLYSATGASLISALRLLSFRLALVTG
jgi:hypothetical protein